MLFGEFGIWVLNLVDDAFQLKAQLWIIRNHLSLNDVKQLMNKKIQHNIQIDAHSNDKENVLSSK